MNIADQSTPEEVVCPDGPLLSVTISPQVADKLCRALKRFIRPRGESGGLLFGASEDHLVQIQAFKSFPERIWQASKSPQATLNGMLSACRTDPELCGLDWVGWYSLRASGGLNQNDLEFHNGHFRRASDIALIVCPEQGSRVSLELYSRSGNAPLTAQQQRYGATSVSRNMAFFGPIEVTIRTAGSMPGPRAEEGACAVALPDTPAGATIHPITPPAVIRWPSEPSTEAVVIAPEDVMPREQAPQPPPDISPTAVAEVLQSTATRSQVEPAAEAVATASEDATAHEQAPQDPSQMSDLTSSDIVDPDFGRSDRTPDETGYSRRSFQWLAFAIASVILVGAALGLFALKWPAGGEKIQWIQSLFSSSGLTLRAIGQSDGILLTWDRTNAIVRFSTGATLQIEDGSHHTSLHLDPNEVRNGSFLYIPATGDVAFVLNVRAANGLSVSDSTRTLAAVISRPPVADTAKPSRSVDAIHAGTKLPEMRHVGGSAEAKTPSQPITQVAPPAPPATRAAGRLTTHAQTTQAQGRLPATGSENLTLLNPVSPRLRISSSQAPSTVPSGTASGASQNLSHTGARRLGDETYVAPQPLHKVLPTRLAPDMVKTAGEIDVEVKVDISGRVTAARIVKNGANANSILCNAVLAAAREWTFQPAKLHGTVIEADCTIAFQFRPSDT